MYVCTYHARSQLSFTFFFLQFFRSCTIKVEEFAHTYIHTYVYTYMYIHTYIHTCTYIHTHTCIRIVMVV